MPHFTDTVVLITGASAGIGRAAALAFAREGVHLVLVARTEERLRPVAEAVEQVGGTALVIPADVSDRDQVNALVDTVIKAFGRIDILLNNAGIGLLVSIEDMEPADLKKLMEPDLTVSLRPTRPLLAVVDEEAVPEEFWKPQPSKLDRQGLISAMAAGRDIPGAILGNPHMTISVRTK